MTDIKQSLVVFFKGIHGVSGAFKIKIKLIRAQTITGNWNHWVRTDPSFKPLLPFA